jgi:hypothetical protein
MLKGAILVALVVSSSACPPPNLVSRERVSDDGHSPVCASSAPEPASSSPLRASLHVVDPRVSHIQDVAVEVTLSNPGSTAVRWLGTYAQAGSLALKIRDASCKAVLPGPPPTPRADDGVTGWNTLLPGASAMFSLDGGVMSDAAPGHYEVRFIGIPGDEGNGEVRSAWMPFEIAPPAE